MDREIKFRARSKYDGEWVYFTLEEMTYLVGGQSGFNDDFECWSQYIGRKDKNSTEIYDDDILKDHKYKRLLFIVKFSTDFLSYELHRIDGMGELLAHHFKFERMEIVGNTEENPDLLMESKS